MVFHTRTGHSNRPRPQFLKRPSHLLKPTWGEPKSPCLTLYETLDFKQTFLFEAIIEEDVTHDSRPPVLSQGL